MAMDERQQQIREGAGLEESRLNVEFIDFLKKWSSPALIVIALLALGYFGYQKWQESQHKSLEAAFADLESAADSGSPAALLGVAEQHAGKAAVAEMARLYAADVYLSSARCGLQPGAQLERDGKPKEPKDVLTPEQVEGQLVHAAELYQAVIDRTDGKPDQVEHTIGGLYGLAAVAESRLKTDEAKAIYQRILDKAKAADLPEEVARAQGRLDSMNRLAVVPKLYEDKELPTGKLIRMSAPPGAELNPLLSPTAPPSQPGPESASPAPAEQPAGPAPAPANPPAPPPGR